jgi:hypothetical protein
MATTKESTEDSKASFEKMRSSAAMAAWSTAVQQANWALFATMLSWPRERGQLSVNPVELLGALPMDAVRLVAWLAGIFGGVRDLHPLEVETLNRITAALQPTEGSTVIFEGLVSQHARLYFLAPDERSIAYQGHTKREIAEQLIFALVGAIAPAYGALMGKFDAVCALLDRYKRGRTGRLNDTGLVVALEKLAGSPLGAYSSSPKAVSEAKRRKRLRSR